MQNFTLESVFDKLPKDKKCEFIRNLTKQFFSLKEYVENIYQDDPDFSLYMSCFYDD